MIARELAAGIYKIRNAPVVVENRPSAGGLVATRIISHGTTNGSLLGFASQGTLIFNTILNSDPGYDPLADFVHVTALFSISNVLITPYSRSYRSLADLVSAAKTQPGRLFFSSGGVGTSHHVTAELLMTETHVLMTHVPYSSAPAAINAVVSGEVDFGFFNTPTVLELIRANRVRALCVTSLQRSNLLPSLPTVAESGIPGFELSSWMGLVLPRHTEVAIAHEYFLTARDILRDTGFVAKMAKLGLDPMPSYGPSNFRQLIARELDRWRPVLSHSVPG
ncbi:Bug family tripartite tricarboxylate transporter substrate binding protein [Roseomonas mucosa]|uniref:Bug family tripartite tricarboxylate transporter substrate binding protein n=1 Tax=Roseomonas mucosa TaxID=207340 RepID=UPI0028CD3B18|nr:tripartite tricarboxylate transporter substrate binding protein [Roseomonas mucosa]MDT8278833.1 tripartite tricarboxylate transporter substrate binding protein [Roseomonas mucosa]